MQNTVLGHRGHKHDPLYRARQLLAKACEIIDADGLTKISGPLAAGDPDGHVIRVLVTVLSPAAMGVRVRGPWRSQA